ncbi:tropomodulin-1 isoform X3 [Cimex lectularius]|uniref:Tropomodulin n=1 Tax=Cimex lectularius TaxID=79782 RepID=A0A8I6S3D0_CIMLE|nr:tropomodulin-1 isoform X3 [Cimex lectularius]
MSTVEEIYEGEIRRKVTRRTSFKIEETSSTTKTSTMTTAAKLYGKDLSEYDEMDVDQLLSQLTQEEISMLVKEVDPDDTLLPPSQRCSYECQKSPTGPLDRKKLIEHINKQALETPDKPELKPFVAGTIRGKKWIPPPVSVKLKEAEEQIAIDLGDEYEQALSDATQEEIIDLAAILGFHSMMNQDQYHASLLNKGQPLGLGWDGITKATQQKVYPVEPPNDTDVDKTIQMVKDDDHELLTLNWNNIRNISDEKFNNLFMALRENTHLETLSLTNVGLLDRHALKLAEAIEKNCTLKVLNVETNFLSPQVILRLIKALLVQKSLEEFRGANQRCYVLGNKIEMEITNLVEQNPTLLRLGLHLEYNDARQRVANHLQRNIDRSRLRRIGHFSRSFAAGWFPHIGGKTFAINNKR